MFLQTGVEIIDKDYSLCWPASMRPCVHYEYGLKMPRQENLEKIAQALDVPMQMLFPIDTCTPVGIATLLLNMQLQFGA